MEKFIDKLKKNFAAWELFSLSSEETRVEFENNKLKKIAREESKGLALRGVQEGKIGFSTSTREDAQDNLIRRAKEISPLGTPYDFEFSPDKNSPKLNCCSPEIIDFNEKNMLDLGKELIEAINIHDSSLLAFVEISKVIYSSRIINSFGLDKDYKKTLFSVLLGGEKTEEGNFLHVYDYFSNSRLAKSEEINLSKKYVQESFTLARRNLACNSGKYRVLFSPFAVQELLIPFLVCSNGKNIQKGISPLRDKLDRPIFAPSITIYDNGVREEGSGSFPFDDEGTCAKETILVENGRLKNFYHNLSSAAALNQSPTGNALRAAEHQRNIENIPSPHPSNIILKGGKIPLKDIFSSLRQGIYIDQLMGTFTSNFLAGELRGNISLGYLIEKGEKVGRIKDAMIALNIFEVLKDQILALSEETVSKGSTCLPYLLLDKINLTTTGTAKT